MSPFVTEPCLQHDAKPCLAISFKAMVQTQDDARSLAFYVQTSVFSLQVSSVWLREPPGPPTVPRLHGEAPKMNSKAMGITSGHFANGPPSAVSTAEGVGSQKVWAKNSRLHIDFLLHLLQNGTGKARKPKLPREATVTQRNLYQHGITSLSCHTTLQLSPDHPKPLPEVPPIHISIAGVDEILVFAVAGAFHAEMGWGSPNPRCLEGNWQLRKKCLEFKVSSNPIQGSIFGRESKPVWKSQV